MAELKTKRTAVSPDDFLNSIKDEQIRADCRTLAGMMQKATKSKPQMWGPSIVGFGNYRYKYPDGREMDWMLIAFSPRKQNITLYVSPDFQDYGALLSRLGKHSCGKSCLYIKHLADVDLPTLQKIISGSVRNVLNKSRDI
jgi:hypothetical protein